MNARISQELAENGVLTRLDLPASGKLARLERVGVHQSLREAADWVQECLGERSTQIEQANSAEN